MKYLSPDDINSQFQKKFKTYSLVNLAILTQMKITSNKYFNKKRRCNQNRKSYCLKEKSAVKKWCEIITLMKKRTFTIIYDHFKEKNFHNNYNHFKILENIAIFIKPHISFFNHKKTSYILGA